ncbi:FecR family protein [Chitinophaga costaii]|uniref:FecR family protein n=1 Tax=Chitinophaga costaii TaxID=1335309 RepID=A0A1C4AU83_9BACT|nr:FecR family protein [Chitinophaga costaii]PUZ26744.1 FecR family protein [Chitinophaga costaii]SCB98117.1 FecR family protein [Chitinophaga costaii]
MSGKKINKLLRKYIDGTISNREKQELIDLYHKVSNENAPYPDDPDLVRDRMFLRLKHEFQPVKRFWNFIKLPAIAAAAIIFIASAGIYLYSRPDIKTQLENQQVAKNLDAEQVILPGKNAAILTLANGERIVLDTVGKGILAVQGNAVITKNNAGEISYQKTAREDNNDTPPAYNTITTPPGGQFTVNLPDGSKVWLNAASSLKYPSSFKGAERHVELTGEAYFEILKNAKTPFTVTAENTSIQVLGTRFNIMAYNDEPSVQTTLLEGAVSLIANKTHKILTPGQQAIASKTSNDISFQTVNMEDAIAWKNGYFSFRKENIRTAMNKVARWYNVEVAYRGNLNDKVLGGSISRTENIANLLDYLALTGIASFKIEGRKIIVTCK